MNLLIKTAVAAVAVAIATPAFAATITLDNLSTGLGRTVKTNLTGNSTYHAGELRWNVTAMTGSAAAMTGFSVGDSISTFCTQLTQTAQSPTVFNLIQVEDAPQPGAGMGALRAGYINTLYANYHGDALLNGTNAAAFQLAIWELVNESESALTSMDLDVSSGDFQVTGGSVLNVASGQSVSAVALANTWLSTILSLFNPNGVDMLALSNDSAQDQLIMTSVVIPLPAPVLLGGLGLLLVPAVRRRFAR